MTQALKRTALYETHVALKGRMVPFAGWEMPVQYEGILAETRAVRRGAGLFDVSHMGRLYISGPQAGELLDWILTADALNLRHGRGRYAMICNPEGGTIDDTVFTAFLAQKMGLGLWRTRFPRRQRLMPRMMVSATCWSATPETTNMCSPGSDAGPRESTLAHPSQTGPRTLP